MQIIYLPKCLRKIWNAPICEIDSLSKQAQKKYRALKLWAQLLSDGLSSAQACAAVVSAYEVSQKSLYRWRSMYEAQGARGLECQSRKPHRVRQKEWDEAILRRICTIRNHEDTCRMGAAKLYHQVNTRWTRHPFNCNNRAYAQGSEGNKAYHCPCPCESKEEAPHSYSRTTLQTQ